MGPVVRCTDRMSIPEEFTGVCRKFLYVRRRDSRRRRRFLAAQDERGKGCGSAGSDV